MMAIPAIKKAKSRKLAARKNITKHPRTLDLMLCGIYPMTRNL
jgi:hypothetical protein